jgi:DNA-binding MarR family transcriptional regulator
MPANSATRRPAPKRSRPTVSDSDYQHLASFRHALREFLHFSEEAAIAAGIPPQQHQAMLAIRGFQHDGSLTVGELAERLKIRHHSAVGLVNRMVADGLALKLHAPHDRRQVLVRLTARGAGRLETLSAAHKAELARVGPALRQILTQLKSVS